MPKYVFHCQNEECNCRFDRLLKMGDWPTHVCPSCGEDAPRSLEGEGFAFGFKEPATKEGNTGVHKEDYPTADHAVGRSAERRWASYGERSKLKEDARKQGGTHALVRRDGEGFVEYAPMASNDFQARKANASKTFEAIRAAKAASR